jgi:hypothetical protein
LPRGCSSFKRGVLAGRLILFIVASTSAKLAMLAKSAKSFYSLPTARPLMARWLQKHCGAYENDDGVRHGYENRLVQAACNLAAVIPKRERTREILAAALWVACKVELIQGLVPRGYYKKHPEYTMSAVAKVDAKALVAAEARLLKAVDWRVHAVMFKPDVVDLTVETVDLAGPPPRIDLTST